jgi:hypothetical protein
MFHEDAGQVGANARCDQVGNIDGPAVVILTSRLPVPGGPTIRSVRALAYRR